MTRRAWILPVVALAALAGAPLVAALAPAALASSTGPPSVSTGPVSHVRGSTAELEATVDPHGLATTYYFQYGPTTAYGFQTPAAMLPASNSRIKVGQITSGLQAGFHYRVVAFNGASNGFAKVGRDRTFAAKARQLTFQVPKSLPPIVYRQPMTLSGTLTGTGSAGQAVALQESPFPYLAAFTTVGAPVTTSASGAFSFHLASLSTSTEFRIITLGSRPVFSGAINQRVTPHIVLKVHRSSTQGVVRLFGTIAPAEKGARVFLQLSKPTRPGNTEKTEERTSHFTTQFSTVARRATNKLSFFSIVVKIVHGGRYRAYVRLRNGPLRSGASSTVVLRAAAPTRH
jgi:hypothetical protein